MSEGKKWTRVLPAAALTLLMTAVALFFACRTEKTWSLYERTFVKNANLPIQPHQAVEIEMYPEKDGVIDSARIHFCTYARENHCGIALSIFRNGQQVWKQLIPDVSDWEDWTWQTFSEIGVPVSRNDQVIFRVSSPDADGENAVTMTAEGTGKSRSVYILNPISGERTKLEDLPNMTVEVKSSLYQLYLGGSRAGSPALLAALLLLCAGAIVAVAFGVTGRKNRPQVVTVEPEERKKGGSKRKAAFLGCFLGCAALCAIFLLPRLVAVFRTVLTLTRAEADQVRRLSWGAGLLGLAAFLLLFLGLWRLGGALAERKGKRKREAPEREEAGPRPWVRGCALLLAGGLLLAAGGFWASRKLEVFDPAFESRVNAAEPVIALLAEGAREGRYRIYEDDLPELYRRRYGGDVISDHLLYGNDLREKKNTVLLTDLNRECYRLLSQGFSFVPISDTEGLYTNSEEALQTLRDAGYAMTGYYSVRKSADAAELAEMNGLPLSEDGWALLGGENRSSAQWPVDFFTGQLQASFALRLTATPAVTGQKIGEVRLQTEDAERVTVLSSLPLYPEMFAETGDLTAMLTTRRGNTHDMRLVVVLEPGTVMELRRFSLEKTGS